MLESLTYQTTGYTSSHYNFLYLMLLENKYWSSMHMCVSWKEFLIKIICHECPYVSCVKLRKTEALVVEIKLSFPLTSSEDYSLCLSFAFPHQIAITVNVSTCYSQAVLCIFAIVCLIKLACTSQQEDSLRNI